MAGAGYEPVIVSRRIGAPAGEIFPVLAGPGRHRGLDGSGMVQEVVSGSAISGVGDVLVMQMYFTGLGFYEMSNHVVEYEPGRRIGWMSCAPASQERQQRRASAVSGCCADSVRTIPARRDRVGTGLEHGFAISSSAS